MEEILKLTNYNYVNSGESANIRSSVVNVEDVDPDELFANLALDENRSPRNPTSVLD